LRAVRGLAQGLQHRAIEADAIERQGGNVVALRLFFLRD
jgi:hypothetical protein